VKGVAVTIAERYYSSASNEYKDRYLPPVITGLDGYFSAPSLNDNDNGVHISITLTDGKDVLRSEELYYSFVSRGNDEAISQNSAVFEKKNANVNFYTDRAIYRPGQKVFFKGIAITEDAVTYKPKLYITTDALRIYLEDVNEKRVDSLSLKLNEYGSLTGSFVLPAHTLTGAFRLEVKDIKGDQSFRVEEYKRPTFYVQIDTLANAYRLKDTITVTGFAQAFAGNFLNSSQVKYNVQRTTRNNFYSWSRRRGSSAEGKQIAEGAVTSDGSGKFMIKFPALPDETVDTSTNPIFDFAVTATVTEAGGETREANTTVSVGYTSLTLKLDVPGTVDNSTFKIIPISVQNLSGKSVDANVHINIYPLQPPGRAVHARYWERPDVFVMGKDEFVRNFPYDEYDNESDVHSWQKASALVSDTFNTSQTRSAYRVKLAALPQGWYTIEAVTTDKDGHEIKDLAYTEVYDALSAAVPAGDDNFNTVANAVLHPGEKASMVIGSVFKDIYVIQQIDKPSQKNASHKGPFQYFYSKLDGDKKPIDETVTEDDRGGLGIYYAFVKHNRFYTGGSAFAVPWDNKQLDIKYTSFRYKTEPGSKEQWTINIKGSDSGNAELLTGMYDASLDQFVEQRWEEPNFWRNYYTTNLSSNHWESYAGFGSDEHTFQNDDYRIHKNFEKSYDFLVTNAEDFLLIAGMGGAHIGSINQDGMKEDVMAAPLFEVRGSRSVLNAPPKVSIVQFTPPKIVREEIKDLNLDSAKIDVSGIIKHTEYNPPLQIRKNFNETAFFFPQVYADTAGNYNIQFTMPESLTKWKWMSLAHTQGLSFGTNEQTIVTQKTLMVQPNMPRFLREGDQIELTARISNMGDTALTGQASLELIDAATGNAVDGLFQNVFPNQYFTAEAGQTTVLKFPVVIPNNYYHPLTYRVVAKTNAFNDGEENTLPVLTNRMLVTESLPLYVKGDTTKQFSFDKLRNNNSETLQTQSLTVEYTANPVWTAIQSLPYLIEYPYECAEQTFNRYYGNTLAAYILQQHPRIKQVFQQWASDSTAQMSNLEKNQELKQVILSETPWVLDAQDESQQKKNISLLFDVVTMGNNTQSALQKLKDVQQADGGFAWFKGGNANRYITQYILTGIGRLQHLNAIPQEQAAVFNAMIAKALVYLDAEANKDYENLVKYKAKLEDDQLSQSAIQYLYMRSYFNTAPIQNKTAYNYYYQQILKYWQHQSEYMKGMIALTLLRTNMQDFAVRHIYPSIIENAVATEEKGMYWKENQWGYYWYQSPIEQQALLIELAEAMEGVKTLHAQHDADEMKTWLINQKQTTNWATTKATADACYALLLNSGPQLEANRTVAIQLGNTSINSDNQKAQAGTGYFKQVIQGSTVTPAMGNITVNVHTAGVSKSASPSYGAVYWQYLEDMDKITGAVTPLSLHKQLFVEKNTSSGKVLTPVTNDTVLHVGDKVVVRIELKSDRDMEYLHLKDMRAASMEPQNVLSEYKWQDGLGYYESTKDAATDFFIDYLPKGSYVFEYPVFITHIGTFSSGIASIQCMYAPEFTSHSEGLKVVVE